MKFDSKVKEMAIKNNLLDMQIDLADNKYMLRGYKSKGSTQKDGLDLITFILSRKVV